MEAVPRLPMVWFLLKVSPEPTTFGPKLKQYIQDFYNEEPESYNSEIQQLENLRSMAVRAPIDMAGCTLLKKYYCQLHFLQSRFPMYKDGPAAVTFTWKDAYTNLVCSLSSIRFEIMSILYNIGAMHTQLGGQIERNSADGMKMACTHFQCAAWAFEHLKNSFPQPFDLSLELMTFMHQLSLAQAQECILEKSMLDNRKPTIVAKVAKQIVDYFTMALTTLKQSGGEIGTISDGVGSKFYKIWKRYAKFKKAYHMAVTYLYQGLAAEEQRKMGERVAFYNAALASLNEAHMIFDSTNHKEEKAAVEESLTFTNDVIEGKRKAAKNENDFIYHEEVPEKESLPTVKGASLVKGISFNINDPEVSGQDIFARFVPMKVHEANSLYSEEKAKILRFIGAKVDEKDQYLNTYLTSLKLEHMNFWDPDTQASEWECLPLPEELLERCAALNAKQHIIQDLVDIMGKLSETSQDVEKVLNEISKFLLEEEQKEKQYQDAVGKRPPSIVATDLTREAKKYEEAHNKASESNQALHKAVTMHVKNLKILAQPLADLMAQIPSPNVCLADQGSEKSQAKETEKMQTKELKRVLNKVDEMRIQRLDLLTKLRDQIVQDDLTRLLVTATSSESAPLDRLFADQLNKHQSLMSLIEQNLAAQDNILAALTDAYAQTANVRKSVEEVLKRREMTISSLINSYDAYEDLLAKSSKGLEFYRKLEINVSKLLQRVKSTCKVQEEEREQILAQDNKNTYEKVDATIPATYDQGRPRSGNGLKLKDYLNSRVEGGTGYQNPYYNLYKGHVASIQMDSKSLTTDMGNKNVIQSPSTIPVSEIPSSAVKSSQHYYPASYADYRTSSPYSYGTQTYYENPVANSILSQSYLSSTTNTTNVYQQPTLSTSTAGVSHSSVQYPTSSYLSNGQTLPTATSQDKFRDVSSNYNTSNTLQYDTYQSPTGYNNYNITTPYVPNQEKVTVKSGITENSTHIQPVPQMPVSTIGAVVASGTVSTVDSPGQASYNIVQQTQLYNNQQKTTLNQEMFHSGQNAVRSQETMPAKDNTLTQNYSLPQTAHSEITYSQNYTTYYNPTELQAQHVPYTESTYDTAVVPPTQYIQSQQSSSSNQSVHSVPSTNEASVPYSSNLHGINPVQYSPQTGTEPSKQNYTDKTYAAYSTQVQMNTVTSNYPNTYQTYQHGTTGTPYEQTSMLPGDASNTYAYINSSSSSEIIQSHAKPTTVQSYSQSYQYSQQVPYSGYAQYPNYSQGQNYAYMQNAHGVNTMAYTYNPANQAQGYTYALNPQDTQTSQTLEATVSVTPSNVTGNGIYQQQEINARYTNAGNNAVVNQTPSSQYSQVYQSQTGNDTYYTTPYGLQMQSQAASVTRPENYTNYNQTYMQAVNNGTNTTTSANPMKLTTKSEEPKSNVDLLSDLDITINHAPLVPEVRPLSTVQKKEEAIIADTTEDDKAEKNEQGKSCKTEQEITPIEDKNDHENLQIVWDTWYNDVRPKKDPLGEPAALQKFINDVEKYEKFVDSLLVKTLSGATNLDIKWKEVQDFEERENGKQSSTVALAHSSENRTIDCIPYDTTRVQISSSDVSSYINASHIMEITQWIPTAFIITQTPLIDKLDIFWTMIWEQESEVIACLVSDAQLNGELYWPISEKDNLDVGNFTISLKKIINHTTYIQRTLSIKYNKKKSERVIVHMQFFVWPSNGFPSSPGAILAFSSDVMTEQALRRCSPKPVIVHCLDGGSLSSLFLVAAATVCHIRADCGIVDVPLVFKGLAKCRKQVVNKESLLFAYRLVLYHAQDILMKRGILSSTRATFDNLDGFKGNKEKTLRKLQCHPSDDFLHNLGVGMQRPDSEQLGKTLTILTSDSTSSSASQEKSNGGVIDPLSQLDPLWSIRR
ncbi:PREDICTED: tyrosine-protein phosphatase non-receptor type 23 [Cyphomyrmex costatus]|uniref:Tyrosine-protein phosphatase non-receptor type 23 n=1 Tax=Cyphomyrmex costatus TaxID=456900 RepID=A0A195CLC9_9HYME|nr:PREDICTED: tyrosine-protein phosphatase non-receptor type 23 [Cyphomyrmex costatus]KYN01526.1 Tyrosine-protein phosphatase non-receptor type 23 [Cyphomyrmex costatus]